jgi:hypothetical protein
LRLPLADIIDHPWWRAHEAPDSAYKAFGGGDIGSVRRLLFGCGSGKARRMRRRGVTVRLGLGHPGLLRQCGLVCLASSVVCRDKGKGRGSDRSDVMRLYFTNSPSTHSHHISTPAQPCSFLAYRRGSRLLIASTHPPGPGLAAMHKYADSAARPTYGKLLGIGVVADINFKCFLYSVSQLEVFY